MTKGFNRKKKEEKDQKRQTMSNMMIQKSTHPVSTKITKNKQPEGSNPIVLEISLYQYIPIELRVIIHQYADLKVKFSNDSLQQAVDMWCSDRHRAYLGYGDISTWDVSQVTSMCGLFRGKTCFNDDISQ